jgi:hypothetical protein
MRVDKYGEDGKLIRLLLATLQDREAYKRSLTTDTMCQNLFDPIRVFEHEWEFELI